MSAANPYAAPVSDPDQGLGGGDAEAVRRRLVAAETSVRAIGVLVLLEVPLTVVWLVRAIAEGPLPAIHPAIRVVLALLTGTMLLRLRSAGRVLFTIVAVFVLLRVSASYASEVWRATAPASLHLWNALLVAVFVVMLALLWRASAKEVCSPRYETIIAATSHVKPKVEALLAFVVVGRLAQLVRSGVLLLAGP